MATVLPPVLRASLALALLATGCAVDGEASGGAFDEDENDDSVGLGGYGGKADGESLYRSGCPGDEIRTGRYALRGEIVGPAGLVTPGVVVVVGERIAAIEPAGWVPPTDLPVIDTGGLIFPGLLDGHSHVEYGHIPLADLGGRYQNRNQWPNTARYDREIKDPKNAVTDAGLRCEAMRWGEVRALVGGTTGIQGTPQTTCVRPLVRNLEQINFCRDRVRQNLMAVKAFERRIGEGPSFAEEVRGEVAAGSLDAFAIHLGEGIDEVSRGEWALLRSQRLDVPQAVMIHATALTAADLAEVGAAGARVIWSPLSNLLLYGRTTDVPAALDAGVLVSLGSDWSPSGSANLLGELKVADHVNRVLWGGRITDRELLAMVTINPAIAYGMDDVVGSIEVGKYADLLVVRAAGKPSAARALIEARPADVLLVTISGDPLYGTHDLLGALGKAGDLETVDACGEPRAIDVTVRASGVEGAELRIDAMTAALAAVNPRLTPVIDCTDDEARAAYAGTPLEQGAAAP